MNVPVCAQCLVRMVIDDAAPSNVWGARGRTVTNGAEGYRCPRCATRVLLYDASWEHHDDERPDYAVAIDGTVTPPEIAEILAKAKEP